MNESEASSPIPPPPLKAHYEGQPLSHWIRRLLECNPFYLVSAACLLYGIYRFTIDPAFRGAELGPVSTIFGSLQLYEILLVATAIFLAWRRIWYDSTLLVALENMFVLIPFILVTLAVFLGPTVTWVVCGTGAAMAIARFGSLKRFIPQLNMPRRFLGLGLLMLAINLTVPFFFKAIHQAHIGPLHEVDLARLAAYSLYGWLIALPLLCGLVNLLPRPTRWGGVVAQRSWLPIGLAAIWITATAVHLWCVGFVYDLVWHQFLLAPLVWVAMWTLNYRVTDFVPSPPQEARAALLVPPALAVLLGTWEATTSYAVFVLAALNVVIFGVLYFRKQFTGVSFHLLLISLATLIAAMPEHLGYLLIPDYSRPGCVVDAILAYIVVRALLSRHPSFGLCGAIAMIFLTNNLLQHDSMAIEFAVQFGAVFFLVHSLRWQDEEHPYANGLRILCGLLWIGHSLAWMQGDYRVGWWTVSTLAVLVLACYVATWLIWHRSPSRVIPVIALIVLALQPGRHAVHSTAHVSTGLLALVASFVLFAVGTIVALQRDKWNPPHHPES